MGLGDVLGLTKSATFQATVTVHELVQVPLLHARFKVKWKFKGATTVVPIEGDDSTSSLSLSHSHSTGFGKRLLHPRSALHNVTSKSNNGTLPSTSSSGGLSSNGGGMTRSRSGSPAARGWDSTGDDDMTNGGQRIVSPSRSPPLSPEQAGGRTPNPNRTPAANNGNPTFAFTSPFSANAETVYTHGRSATQDTVGTEDSGLSSSVGRRRGAADAATVPALAAAGGKDAAAGAKHPLPKGSTSYVPLRAHTATFNRVICCPVQIPLRHLSPNALGVKGSKAKYQLQPSPVRFSTKQEVLTDDGKREEVKLGEVVLDLSQFVGRAAGGKESEERPRRYLLQDCKSNAVLKVSVKMELIDGDANFIAPPLKSGQMSITAPAVKGLHSSQNSPMNRSTVSLNKSHSSTASAALSAANVTTAAAAARLSTSTFSTSHSSQASTPAGVTRTSSMSSTGTRTSSRNSPASSGQNRFPGLTARTGSAATSVNGKKGKKKGWHPPSSALANASTTLLSTSASASVPNSAHTTTPSFATSGAGGERAASDVIDAIFNRPKRNPSWVGFSTASRPSTPGLGDGGETFPSTPTPNGMLGNPFEYDPSMGRGRKSRRSAPPGLSDSGGLSAGEKEKSGKAWSIRSGIERHKEKKREKGQLKVGAERDGERRPHLRVPGAASVTDDERERGWDDQKTPRPHHPAGFRPSVQVQPPTPQTSFSASSWSQQPPSRPPPPPPRPLSTAPPSSYNLATRPPSLGSSGTGSNGRALSVRWGDAPTPSSSISNSPRSTAPSTLPSSHDSSADRRSLRHSKSNDSTLSTSARSVLSTRSQRSQKDFNPGLGLSASSTPSATPSPASSAAPSPEKARDFAPPASSRPPSQLSFNSVVTPPSPEKKPAGSGGAKGEKGKKAAPGEKAPGGMDWGKSWG